MIDIATARDSLANTGQNPYVEPADVMSNPQDYGNPYDDMIQGIRQMVTLLTRLVNLPEDMRVQPRATQISLNTTTPYSNTISFRTSILFLTTSAACTINLQVSSSVRQSFNFGGPGCQVFPYIDAIGAGNDILLVTTAGTVSGYLIAYPMG